jgi:Na+-driven multidrug efflux pump
VKPARAARGMNAGDGEHDTRQAAYFQAIDAVIIPIECLAAMMSLVVVSPRAKKALFYGSAGIFTFTIVAGYVFKKLSGVAGIVAATVSNQAVSLVFFVFLWRRMWNRRTTP